MKKRIASILTVAVVCIFSSMMPAHASALDEQLTQLIAQNANVDRVQQLLMLKKQWEQEKKQGILEAVTKAAVEQSKQGIAANVFAQDNINQIAENILRQQTEKAISDKVAPYEKELAVIAALFNNQSLVPQVTRDNNSLTVAPQNYKRILNMTSTAYAPGSLDNGKWNNQTYVGGIVRPGVAAVDPRVIPMGTKLWIEGYGEAIAEDQGSAIKGNRIDLVFNNRQDALDYGIKNVKVYVLN